MKNQNDVVEKIIHGNDIVNVVSEYVSLERKGKNYFGLCPFHQEKTPSFSVSPEKQIFHCFSCGEGGNVVNFIAKIDNLSYTESIKKLASRINVKINDVYADNKNEELTKYYNLNKFVSDFYHFTLINTSEGNIALNYLYNRGLTIETIKQFKIGVAPNGGDLLYQALKANNFPELLMLELGHVIKSNDKYYDKFKNRIMFPITDDFNNIVGFSGRVYLEGDKNEAKYINTQETPIFKKSNVIYNLDNAKKYIKQNNKVILFEGFMDVIASVNSNLLESVATMGTALTDTHVDILKSYTNNFIICYDGDSAGIEATKRAINILNKHYVNIAIVQLPNGLDPDDYVKKYGNKKYLDYINNYQKSLNQYLYEEYYKKINLNNITSIENFKEKVFSFLKFASSTEKEIFINRLSNDINVSVATLNFDFNKFTKNINKNANNIGNEDIAIENRIYKTIEKYRPNVKKITEAQDTILYLIIHDKKYIDIIANDSSVNFPNEMYRRIYHDLDDYYKLYNNFVSEHFMSNYVNDDEKYKEFYMNFIKGLSNFKIQSYELNHLEQCMAVLRAENIYNYVNNLKRQIKETDNEEIREKLSQKVIEQFKVIKTTKN